MKHILASVIVMLVATNVFAIEDAHTKLVAEYIKAARLEQINSAEIDASIRQYSVGLPPEAKAQIERVFSSAMGWETIKNEYAELIARTYTTQELKASLAFVQTSIGGSIAKKNVEFAGLLATLMAKSMKKVTEEAETATKSTEAPVSRETDTDLVVSDVEEHLVGGNTYFTGQIANHGKGRGRHVEVQVNLFMAGKFVDQYNGYLSGSIASGDQRYFKISCGCKDSPPAPHDSYKIRVIDTY